MRLVSSVWPESFPFYREAANPGAPVVETGPLRGLGRPRLISVDLGERETFDCFASHAVARPPVARRRLVVFFIWFPRERRATFSRPCTRQRESGAPAGTMSHGGRNECRIYVGNLPPDIRTKDIQDLFYKFGKVTFVDLKNRRGPPFAFVEFDDPRWASQRVGRAPRSEHPRPRRVSLRVRYLRVRARPAATRRVNSRRHAPIEDDAT